MTPEDIAYCDNVIVAGTHFAKYNTFEIVEGILQEGILGEFAECGVMAGGHIAVMDRALRKHGQGRIIHAFDSFDGIPQASDNDNQLERETYGRYGGGAIKSSGVSRVDVAGFQYFMAAWGVKSRIEIHKGWFEETMEKEAASVGPLALLRIDVDLYNSTIPVLKYLYPKVVSGGYIIDDDWGDPTQGEPPCRRAVWECLGTLPAITHVEGNPGTCWWRKP